MGLSQASQLVQSFLEDHRRMTRLLARVHRALEDGQVATARDLAEELDRVGGPHIDFEEQVLYPLIAGAVDRALAQRLYEEHAVVRKAIAQLLETAPAKLERDTVAGLLDSFHVGLDHASNCGTLASHLDGLPASKREQALETLQALRELGRRWTTLPPPPDLGGDDERPGAANAER